MTDTNLKLTDEALEQLAEELARRLAARLRLKFDLSPEGGELTLSEHAPVDAALERRIRKADADLGLTTSATDA